MKKVIIPALFVTLSLVLFSFKPISKQAATYDKKTGNLTFFGGLAGSFTESYSSGTCADKTWSEWHKTWSDAPAENKSAQIAILNKY
jgi:hypothetical protein